MKRLIRPTAPSHGFARSAAQPHQRRSVATAAATAPIAVSQHDESSTRPSRQVAPAPTRQAAHIGTDTSASPSGPPRPRLEALRQATREPFSSFLTDTFGRRHTYLRISLTERCNLRCTYCMPAEGVPLSADNTQLTTPEIAALAGVFVDQGVTKIRLTGGEPTVRRDFVTLATQLGGLRGRGLRELCVTSNGLALRSKLEPLVEAGLTGVNLSLDTLEPGMFEVLTRRRGFDRVLACMHRILDMNRTGAGVRLKVNVVVMRGINDVEIPKFVELGRNNDLEVRFIEYMPFDGNRWARRKMVSYAEMLAAIRREHPDLEKVVDGPTETSKTWRVPGFAGRIGFITSMTDNFCAGCNRLRVTSDGNLKVCLFGNAEVSLRDLLRKANGGEPINQPAWDAMMELQHGQTKGLDPVVRQELLDVIGAAVGRKKERHAGMGALENMPNRPMILIDDALKSTIWTKRPSAAKIPSHLLSKRTPGQLRLYWTKRDASSSSSSSSASPGQSLPHLTSTSEIHVVSVSNKRVTRRTATAVGSVMFSSPIAQPLVRAASLRKGDALAVARIAGVMAAKRTPDLVPLCHSGVGVEGVRCRAEVVGGIGEEGNGTLDKEGGEGGGRLEEFLRAPLGPHGGVRLAATVECEGKTGVEMEALCAVAGAGLSVLDMVKAVDKHCVLGGIKAVQKSGGRSSDWEAEVWE